MKYVYPIDFDADFSVDNGSITNAYRIHDGAIDLGATITINDRVQFDYDTVKTPDSVAIYVTSGSGNVSIRTAQTTGEEATGAISAGWNIITIGSGSSVDWYVHFTSVSSLVVAEIYFSDEFDFPWRYDLGATEQAQFGVSLVTGQGGGEFSNKNHNEKTLRNWNWRTFSEANKTAYKAMVTAIGGIYAKILWFDDTTYHWIRLQNTPVYTEQTFGAYGLGQPTRSQLQ